MIVSLSDFKVEASIPGLLPTIGNFDISNDVRKEKVEEFIEKYERKYLVEFLGHEKTVELYEYHNLPESEKDHKEINGLINSLKLTIPYYISYFLFIDDGDKNTENGAIVQKFENATKTGNMRRLVLLWNEMVGMTINIVNEFGVGNKNAFKFQNQFNI